MEGRTLVGVERPLGFLKPSSEEADDASELKDDFSDLVTDGDFLDLKSFPGLILVSFMVEMGVKRKMRIHPKSERGGKREKKRRRIGG